ncbi:MAG: site-specific integrase [Crocinitomicaceae bacterium]
MKTDQSFSILFWIYKSKARNGKAPIYCRITVNSRRSQFSLKRSIEIDKWNSKAGVVKGNSEISRTLNAYLDLVKGELHRHYNKLLAAGGHISSDAIKNSYLGISNQGKTLFETFTYHNELAETRIGIDLTRPTWVKFETVRKKLESYVKDQYRCGDVPLERLNHQFIEGFEYYLKTKEHISHNTTLKYIQTVRTVINMAIRNEWIHHNPFANFKASFKPVEREALTEKEIEQLATKKFSIARLEEVRDIFLFCCYTGYAFIDVKTLTPHNIMIGIDGEKWIFTKRQKTRNKSNVPLLPQAAAIIDKYEDHDYCRVKEVLLPVKSNQKMNAYLKEIGDLCGIKKKLTMHIARHTFATTVTLANGVPIESVSSMLGHSSIRTTQIYAKVIEKKVSEDMRNLRNKMAAVQSGQEDTQTG